MLALRTVATLAAAIALLAVASAARAGDIAPSSAETFAAAVPGHPALTWGAALKTFLPDVGVAGDGAITATTAATVRHFSPSDDDSLPDTLRVEWLAARDVVEAGRPRLLIFADMDASGSGAIGFALLALIDPAPQPRLLDLIDVADDRENYLDGGAPLKIGRGSDLILVTSAHLDAGADYAIRKALFVDRDRIGLVASVQLVSLTACGYQSRQSADFAVLPRPGAEFATLQARVIERGKRVAEDCDPQPTERPGVKTWRSEFSWSPAKRAFVANNKALDALAKHNQDGL
jgi:hypothetical protein